MGRHDLLRVSILTRRAGYSNQPQNESSVAFRLLSSARFLDWPNSGYSLGVTSATRPRDREQAQIPDLFLMVLGVCAWVLCNAPVIALSWAAGLTLVLSLGLVSFGVFALGREDSSLTFKNLGLGAAVLGLCAPAVAAGFTGQSEPRLLWRCAASLAFAAFLFRALGLARGRRAFGKSIPKEGTLDAEGIARHRTRQLLTIAGGLAAFVLAVIIPTAGLPSQMREYWGESVREAGVLSQALGSVFAVASILILSAGTRRNRKPPTRRERRSRLLSLLIVLAMGAGLLFLVSR